VRQASEMVERFQGMAVKIAQEMPFLSPAPHARELAMMTGRLLRQMEDHLGREVSPEPCSLALGRCFAS
jgi:hypothetical protein